MTLTIEANNTTSTLSKEDIQRFEYWVTDMAEHQFLRNRGIKYNFVKVIGNTTVYKYPRTVKVLRIAKEFSELNNSLAEYWVIDMAEHKLLRDYGVRFNFVKVIDNVTIYKYPKTTEVYEYAIDYTINKAEAKLDRLCNKSNKAG